MTQPTDDDRQKAAAIWQELLTMPSDGVIASENDYAAGIIARALADAREEAPLRKRMSELWQMGADTEMELQNRIAELEAALSSTAADLDESRAEVESLRGSIAGWEARLRSMTQERDRLQKHVALLKSERDEAYEELSQ